MTHLSISTGLLLFLAATLPAEENFRVVVQDVRPEFLSVSRDSRVVVARGYWSQHTFQVIEFAKPAVLMVVDLPERVTYAVVAPKNDWFIVSGEDTIYRVDRITGKYEVLLTNTSGAMALNDEGDRLAVLGSVNIDQDIGRKSRFRDVTNLGVYDLTRKKWLSKTRTPIVIDRLVYFDGDDVVGYGRGGRVYHRRASSFRCDV